MFCAGKGAGKTLSCAREAIRLAVLNRGCLGVVTAPTYRMLEGSTERTLMALFDNTMRATKVSLVKRYRKSQKLLQLVNGSEILFLSLDAGAQRLEGLDLAWFWVDEAGGLSDGQGRAVWNELCARLRSTLAVRHCGIVSTSPKGRRGVVGHFVEAVERKDPDYEIIRSWSTKNPFLPPGFVARMRANYSDREIRQEIYGEILDNEGTVYAEAYREEVHVRPFELPRRRDGSVLGEVYVAIDWGYNHPAVLFIHHDVETGIDTVFHEFVEDHMDHWSLIQTVVQETEKQWHFKLKAAYPDPNPKAAVEQLVAAYKGGLPCIYILGDDQDIRTGVDIVRGRFMPAEGRPKLFISSALRETRSRRGLLKALKAYQWRAHDGEATDRPDKDGVNDHVCDALRYYCLNRYRYGEQQTEWPCDVYAPYTADRAGNIIPISTDPRRRGAGRRR